MAVNGALIDDKVMSREVFDVYVADANTALPKVGDLVSASKKTAALTAWKPIGHMSSETGLKIAKTGGELSTKSTLQVEKFRVKSTSIEWSAEGALVQFDEDSIKRFFGINATVDANGYVNAPTAPKPEELALLMIARDADMALVMGGRKVAVVGNGDFTPTNKDGFIEMPLKFTFLQDSEGNSFKMSAATKVTA